MSSSILFPTNEYATASKSPQQIQKLMMPLFESTPAYLNHILTKGHPLQHQYAYKQFHKFAHQTLQNVCLASPNAEADNQIIIIESLQILMSSENNGLTPDDLEILYQMVIDCLNNWNCGHNDRLIQILQKIIQLHPHSNHLVNNLQKTVLELGRNSQPIISRVIAGRLISILPRYTGGMIKGQMVDILKRIHADAEIQAKKIWVGQIFPKMLCNSQLQFIELHLQQKIYESVYDQNQEVGLIALQTILKYPNKFSIQQQSSRIIKLFLDSLTSKSQRVSLMVSQIMGQVYQKLQNVILKNQQNCVRFWKAVVQLAQSKNQKVLNNMLFNLPGVLFLANKHYKVQAICDVYVELFYENSADKLLLAKFFHQMAVMFPSKSIQLKNAVYTIFSQIFEDCEQANDQCFKIVDTIISNLYEARQVFFLDPNQNIQNQEGFMYLSLGNQSKQKTMPSPYQKDVITEVPQYFQQKLCQNLLQYLSIILLRKNSTSLRIFYESILASSVYFPPDFTEQHLLPKLYLTIRIKTVHLDVVVKTLVALVSRDVSSNILINNYVSRVNVQLSKSSRSFEREAAMQFFYNASFCFSIQTFQEFKLGQKFLHMHNDRNFKNKVFFLKALPRLIYFFTREQKIQNAIILNRFWKDSDPQIIKIMQQISFHESEQMKQLIVKASRTIKQKERQKVASQGKRMSGNLRRQSKQFKKDDILKKRIQTKSKAKIVIKQVPKRKNNSSKLQKIQVNFRKNS